MIPLTTPEVRRLVRALSGPPAERAFHLQWSAWRRRRQAVAKRSHWARWRTRHRVLYRKVLL